MLYCVSVIPQGYYSDHPYLMISTHNWFYDVPKKGGCSAYELFLDTPIYSVERIRLMLVSGWWLDWIE